MSARKTAVVYLFATLFCIALNYVYSLFGHGVSSPFMSYAFVFSLVLGVVGFLLLDRLNLNNRVAFNLYNAGIATLTVGSILRGIIDIAGADTVYPVYYFYVGAILVVAGALTYFYQWIRTNL
ncbi:MAG: hypothetical protein MHPDNHAH_00135 [Anaerolineales bacterium]|nr:hypothetical protein [Anaerolineales bacterium]WKZ47105.1 MAG: hypothetical protein QY306_14930 [Anaerolineales bacterium]